MRALEIRHDLLNAGDLAAITLVGFTDFAHLDDPDARQLSPDHRSVWGAGAGVLLCGYSDPRLSSLNFAGGANGFAFSMGTGWAF